MDVGACRRDSYNTEQQVIDCNQFGVHIELVGDFNTGHPTQSQYDAIKKINKELKLEYK